ncbi:MAG: diguanylate cyclase [Pseudomonadota bacterium]
MEVAAALVWPALALVFAAVFVILWVADRTRRHLLGFTIGFFALFLSMTVVIAVPSMATPYGIPPLHALACVSVIAIVWGSVTRLKHRAPLLGMGMVSLVSCMLLFIALDEAHHPVALIVQNLSSGILFAIGAMSLWAARSTSLLDRVLVWTMSLLSCFSVLRPIFVLYYNIEVTPMIEREIELTAINVVILTVLTAVLGITLVMMAIQEMLEIRHGSERNDTISGFLDQRTFESNCEPVLATAQRLKMPVVLAVIKLDWFQKIRGKWGPDTSDMVIRQISDVVRAWQRDSDVIGRIGEDQFGILFVGVGADSAQKIVCKLRRDVDQACNDQMSGLLKFTLSSSIYEADTAIGFKDLLRKTLTPLLLAQSLGSTVSFVNGREKPDSRLGLHEDGTFVTHG